jgi:prolyl-tRNA synthetase
VSEVQCVIIPVGVTNKTSDEDKKKLYGGVDDIHKRLIDAGVRAEKDTRDNYNAVSLGSASKIESQLTRYKQGWKFADYELKGIPLRLEFGPRDLASGNVLSVRRDTGEKATIAISDLEIGIKTALETMQNDMFNKAKKEYDEHRVKVTDWETIIQTLNAKNVVLIPSCLDGDCCDAVKDETAAKGKSDNAAEDAKAPSMGAKALCIPFDQESLGPVPEKCLRPSCGKAAQKWVQFGRSY